MLAGGNAASHLKAFCGRRSAILIHDTIPFDEVTQRPVRQRSFYTGDIWKTVLCLKHCRPDLDIITVATPWSGLTIVTGLDPASRVLSEGYEEYVARFDAVPYADVENRLEEALNIVPNDWGSVARRLRQRGIIRR